MPEKFMGYTVLHDKRMVGKKEMPICPYCKTSMYQSLVAYQYDAHPNYISVVWQCGCGPEDFEKLFKGIGDGINCG